MENNVGYADRHDQKLANEGVLFAASKRENDVTEGELIHREKIENNVNENKNNVYEKSGSKRKERFSMNEVDNNKKGKMVVDSEATTQLKEFITSEKISGSDMKLVIEKTLYASDLKRSQNRLNMPFTQVQTHDFLTPEEKQVIDIKTALKVQIMGPNLQMREKPLSLRIWNMSRARNYVLTSNWCDFVEENKNVLKENTTIQVWSFRKDEKLCFAVICVDKPVENTTLLKDASSAGSLLIRRPDLELLEH